MKKIRLIVAAALVSSAGVAYAGDIYLAGSIGQSDFGSATGATSSDQHGTAFKLQLGYQFNPNWAIEGGYVNLGKATYNEAPPNGTLQVKASGWNIGAVGTVPLNDKFSLFGKFGIIDGKVEANDATGSGSATKWRPTYGFGVKYDVSKTLGILAEYEHFDKLGDNNTSGTASINLLSAGVMAKF
jgi:OOP family OmpA-OmpF porin